MEDLLHFGDIDVEREGGDVDGGVAAFGGGIGAGFGLFGLLDAGYVVLLRCCQYMDVTEIVGDLKGRTESSLVGVAFRFLPGCAASDSEASRTGPYALCCCAI